MPSAAEEFAEPVAYGGHWLWLALAAVLLAVAWYLGVWLWSIPRKPKPAPQRTVNLPDLRTRHLAELDRIEAGVRTGELPERDAYQQMSTLVRSFVSGVSGIPTETMTLSDLRAAGLPRLPETVELMYPPEFSPDPVDDPEQRLTTTLSRARELVSTWN